MNNEVWLTEKLKDYDWFHSVGLDVFGRLVVYVNYLNLDVYNNVPDTISGQRLLIHFASNKEAKRDQFTGSERKTLPSLPVIEMDVIDITDEVELLEDESPPDLRSLTNELDRLEKICGSHIMQDIFYEVHDGGNAVTNLSVKFPEVRSGIEKLYQRYGFDVIYEEMDG
jgi:hypothetical protein